ncbi:MAG: lysine exporter LysO family protein [Clostridiaceae bacterium]|nr:lysine exporter LysO family protein [Clostridiaceae bacterium]MBW4859836.1 lysine exporter LysO family protein [Clostridiaceae bacterium]MBW4869734.1 lysine exporter LysO family protein [Clostridiaceae bacterium]
MSLSIILAVVLGIGAGYFILPDWVFSYTGTIADIGLCLLLFFVGMDIGKQKGIFKDLKKMGFKILLVPIMIIIGSILGSIVGGFLLKMPTNESGAVGAGLGWYTLSSVMLTSYSTELSAIAFLTNVIREIIALIIVPIIAKHIGYLECIAPCGATAMDTALPVISKSTDSKTTIVSFISGVILSLVVPILVSIMIKI